MNYYCKNCNCKLEYPKNRIYLTSYPIDFILECPNCKQEYYLLIDNVLCTEKEYKERIYKHYKKE